MPITPTAEAIIARLDELAAVQARAAVIRLDYAEKRRAIEAVIQADLDALNAEYEPLLAVADAHEQNLTDDIKAAVLAHGQTVKGESLRATYSRGRVAWDGKLLNGYAAAHPEIKEFQTVGEPYVSMSAVKA